MENFKGQIQICYGNIPISVLDTLYAVLHPELSLAKLLHHFVTATAEDEYIELIHLDETIIL